MVMPPALAVRFGRKVIRATIEFHHVVSPSIPAVVSAESDRSIDEPNARLRVAQVVSGRLKVFDAKLLGDPFPQIAFCADDSIILAGYCVFGPIAVKQKPTASMETAGTPPVEAEWTVSLRGGKR